MYMLDTSILRLYLHNTLKIFQSSSQFLHISSFQTTLVLKYPLAHNLRHIVSSICTSHKVYYSDSHVVHFLPNINFFYSFSVAAFLTIPVAH